MLYCHCKVWLQSLTCARFGVSEECCGVLCVSYYLALEVMCALQLKNLLERKISCLAVIVGCNALNTC